MGRGVGDGVRSKISSAQKANEISQLEAPSCRYHVVERMEKQDCEGCYVVTNPLTMAFVSCKPSQDLLSGFRPQAVYGIVSLISV